jgi:hypothetical protein
MKFTYPQNFSILDIIKKKWLHDVSTHSWEIRWSDFAQPVWLLYLYVSIKYQKTRK